ncbi:MAG: hypothetical protein EOO75_21275, partial [Myxococcales bacterium]
MGHPSRPPSAGSLVGRLLHDRYRVTATLGRGAGGVVYAADDERSGASVVIKVAAHAAQQTRLRQEAEVLAALDHPCLARLLDAGALDDQTPYLVLARLRGETLASRLQRDHTLPARGERLAPEAREHEVRRLVVERAGVEQASEARV